MGDLFKTKTTSGNTTSNGAYSTLQPGLTSNFNAGTGATNILSSLLSGGAAGQQGLQSFQNSSGYGNQLDSMSRAITGNQAANGLLRSGSTGTAIQTGADNLANQSFSNYLGQLMGLAGLGNQSGSLMGQLAPTSSYTKNASSPSLAGILAGGLSAL